MNSVLDLVLTDIDMDLGEHVCAEIYNKAVEYEQILSCHDPEAEVYQLNENASHNFVSVSKPLLNVLLECKHFHTLTKGYFDAGLKCFKSQSLTEKESQATCGFSTIEIDEQNQAIRFRSPDTAVDLGGIGKGILLREADNILTRYGIMNCFISFGGSSILTRGTHPYGNGWPVALREGSDYTFYLTNHAASFSESRLGGQDTAHIIHPKHLKPVENKRLTFVQALCPVVSEVLSTTLVVAPIEEVSEIIGSFQVIKAFIFNRPDQLNFTKEYQYGN